MCPLTRLAASKCHKLESPDTQGLRDSFYVLYFQRKFGFFLITSRVYVVSGFAFALIALRYSDACSTPGRSGRCCHSCIKEGWNFTITKAKLSRCSGKSPTCALPVIPKYCYLFRLNESHEILAFKGSHRFQSPFT